MGCGNCGTDTNGKPAGCKSNGGCSSSGCNKMNVFDWLSTLPLPSNAKPFPIVEVSFNQGSRKEYFKTSSHINAQKGQWIVVEGTGGFDIGQLSLSGELVKLQLKKYAIQDQNALKKVLRIAQEEDLELYNDSKSKEKEILVRSRAIAKELKVDMKIGEVELQADGKKATFFYTAEHRVDFRELIKVFANDFKTKIEMRQIGARQESAKLGGIGSCGRELCCSTWLSDFKSVNTTAARYQSLSINQAKLSGQCGRLKCCLNFELDTYMDALKNFPSHADQIQTAQGKAHLIKKDIFKNLMWYSFQGSSKQYPLSIERVKEILELNKRGEYPEELKAVELEQSSPKEKLKVDMGFVNDVGQLSLKNLEPKRSKHKKSKSTAKSNTTNSETGSNKVQNAAPKTANEKNKNNPIKTNPNTTNQTAGQKNNKPSKNYRNNKPKQGGASANDTPNTQKPNNPQAEK